MSSAKDAYSKPYLAGYFKTNLEKYPQITKKLSTKAAGVVFVAIEAFCSVNCLSLSLHWLRVDLIV